MSVYTTQEIINIAKISQYLATAKIAKKGLWGGGEDLRLPRLLYSIRKSVENDYNLNQSDSSLYQTATYLYGLCAPYNQKAIAILNNGNGGQISPIAPPTTISPLEFIVTDSSVIPSGSSSIMLNTFPYDFRNYNLIFARNNSQQTMVDNGSTYYTWNKVTGLFQCIGLAVDGELFSITPVF